MYQAIYRKYRPDTFDKVIGRDELVAVLKNQVATSRLSHAYIFSGTRGTGKTSCAKIMARAVNCLNPKYGNPCNECENCRAILEEKTMDVVEMDAASNRRIDDIRELRDKVIYPPSTLKYKVYIIDEAHMITNEGFNALLKIMEEPPRHLIFILATTELEKIPQTILSRCQRFDFPRLELNDIEKSIQYITKDLGIEIDSDAVEIIASAADGAMRDAQSILDQVIAGHQGRITAKIVSKIVGRAEADLLFTLVDAIQAKDEEEVLKISEQAFSSGLDAKDLLASLSDHYNKLLIAKTCDRFLEKESKERVDKLKSQSSCFSLTDITDSLEIILDAQDRLKFNDLTKIVCQITLVKLINHIDKKSLESRLRALEKKLEEFENFDYQTGKSKKSYEIKSTKQLDDKKEVNKEEINLSAIGIFEDNPKKTTEIKSDEKADVSLLVDKEETEKREESSLDSKAPNDITQGQEDKDTLEAEKSEDALSDDEVIKKWDALIDIYIREDKLRGMYARGLYPYELKDNNLKLALKENSLFVYNKAIASKDELEDFLVSECQRELRLTIDKTPEVKEKEVQETDQTDEDIINRIKEVFGDIKIEDN